MSQILQDNGRGQYSGSGIRSTLTHCSAGPHAESGGREGAEEEEEVQRPGWMRESESDRDEGDPESNVLERDTLLGSAKETAAPARLSCRERQLRLCEAEAPSGFTQFFQVSARRGTMPGVSNASSAAMASLCISRASWKRGGKV